MKGTNRKKLFNCSQELLYLVCILGWGYFRDLLALFKAFKGSYTDVMAEAALKAVDDAKKIAGQTQRNADVSRMSTEFKTSVKENCKNFQKLKRYIKSAFEPQYRTAMYNAAGAPYYKAAYRCNGSDVRSLLEAANTFITDRLADLTKNDNMPADFAKIFTDASLACIELSKKVVTTKVTTSGDTTDKNAADNEIYTTLQNMFDDAKIVFENDKSNLQKFVFSQLLKKAKGSQPASMSGYMYDKNKLPLMGIEIVSEGGQYVGVTGKKGRYEIKQMAEGSYIFRILRKDAAPVVVNVVIKAGTRKYLNYTFDTAEEVMKAA